MSTEEILAEREKTHGDFPTQAMTAQNIKHVMSQTPNWYNMPSYMREALDLIATKLSRIGHGNWQEPDHARDGAGYFTLIAKELEK